MAIQLSTDVRNARLNAIETTIGTSAKLLIFTGSPPASCAASDSGSLLATISLPSDYMEDAAVGAKVKAGTWSVAASGTGTAGHFRIKDSTQTTTHMQGTITSVTTGTGDMLLDNVSLSATQTVTVVTCTLTDGNA